MRRVLATLFVTILAAGTWGCGDDTPRSDVQIFSVHGNGALQSDVLNNGDDQTPNTGDDFIPEDEVRVVFSNYPSQSQTPISPTGAFGRVTMTRYRVSFTSPSGAAIPTYVGGMHAVVAANDTTGASLVVAPGVAKLQSPLVDLRAGGEIVSTARVECWGFEHTSQESLYVFADFVVNFANFGDAE